MIYSTTATVSSAGTRVALASSRTPACWVHIQFKSGIAGKLYVGDKTVSSTNGIALSPTDIEVLPPVADLNIYDLSTIYVDADSNNAVAVVLYARH